MNNEEIFQVPFEDGTVMDSKLCAIFHHDETCYVMFTPIADPGKLILMKATFDNGDLVKFSRIDEEEYQTLTSEVFSKYDDIDKLTAHELYYQLKTGRMTVDNSEWSDVYQGMGMVEQLVNGWYKQRYLINRDEELAYEFIDDDMEFALVGDEDIDWDSLEGVPEYAINVAKTKSAEFPTRLRCYEDGIAEVEWTLNPDGRYYMDEDGYGMTDDEQISLFGYVDKYGRVVAKFRNVRQSSEFEEMKQEAKRLIAKLDAE